MFAIFCTELGFDDVGLVDLHCNNFPFLIDDLDDLEGLISDAESGKYILAKIDLPLEGHDGMLELTKPQIKARENILYQLVNAAQKMPSNEGITVRVKVIAVINKIPHYQFKTKEDALQPASNS